MIRSRLTTIVLGGALLTSWLVAAAGTFLQAPPPVAALPPARPSDVEVLAETVREQAERLRTRIDAAPALRDVVRNPFAFEPPPRDAARQVVATTIAEPPRVAPAAPARLAPTLGLVAIVTDRGARRAVLSAAGEIAIVSVGDLVVNRYRVAAISADVVELEDDRGGPTLRLALR